MKTFAEATAVHGGDGVYQAELDPQWAIGDKLHGGYLMAILCRAVAGDAALAHLVAVTTTFLRPPKAGPATVRVELLRAGRTSGQFRARLEQDGTSCAEALVTQGELDESAAFWSSATTPEMTAEDDCVLLPSNPPGAQFPVHLLDVVEHRISPADLGFALGQPSQSGRIASWLRLADGADWDPLSMLVALDPAPPISLTLGITGWAPTITLTAYLRRLPAPGPLRVTMHSTEILGGRMDEVVFVWDAKDNLVAQATQLAGVRH
ncbi:thioesterase family protein [Paractinoplanes ferrugineus]|uniref:Thioesterase family protein n=1 Tax=Paractinoplanes ferrugineus TaxID=113564 RepID=A0A919IXZ7_9ACTN|nr:thioesterase family protein [Actinoplanes ferrugineus]GIE09358.1 hypothetical protein Afe05nite_11980 [Actinoplanes ferrugineus]